MRVVGGDHPIADAALKVTGGLAYATDLGLPGMLHAKLVLSRVAHGRVVAVDTGEALALPELPVLLSPEESLRDDATPIHPGGNLVHERYVSAGDEAPSQPDDLLPTTSVSTPRIHHAALEPHACIADYE